MTLANPVATPQVSPAAPPTLVVGAYDSLLAKKGLGPAVFALFEKKCGCQIKSIAVGDGAQLLSRLQIDHERGKPQIQIAMGIDRALWERAKPYLESWGSWMPRGYERLNRRVEPGFLPFDYGVFAFMSDADALSAAHLSTPKKLAELLQPEWRKNVILEDPRTSVPGLAFVLYGATVGGERFWAKFRSQWLTLAPGWDAAYGLFLKKEAPLVWSYTSSQAYHEAHGDRPGRYRALVFEEGNPVQIEGAALVKGALKDDASKKLARDFLEFLLAPEVQALVPEKNWMLPVMPGTALPASFKKVPEPLKVVETPVDPKQIDILLQAWKKSVSGH